MGGEKEEANYNKDPRAKVQADIQDLSWVFGQERDHRVEPHGGDGDA